MIYVGDNLCLQELMRHKGYEPKSFTPGYLKPKKESDV